MGNDISAYATQHSRKAKTSTTRWQKSEISHNHKFFTKLHVFQQRQFSTPVASVWAARNSHLCSVTMTVNGGVGSGDLKVQDSVKKHNAQEVITARAALPSGPPLAEMLDVRVLTFRFTDCYGKTCPFIIWTNKMLFNVDFTALPLYNLSSSLLAGWRTESAESYYLCKSWEWSRWRLC